MHEQIKSPAEVEQILFQIGELQREIDSAEQKRDASIDYFQQRIDDANEIFKTDTQQARMEIDELSIALRNYFDADPPTRKKSMAFAGGTFGYVKQSPRFSFNDEEANADSKPLLEFVKRAHNEFVKVKESVDWKSFKSAIDVDGDKCYLRDTGEIIDGLRAFTQPDKFFVKPRITT